jgi:hypothetical protein
MTKAAQRQFLVRVSGVDGYFATKSGGATASDVTDVWDGGSLTPEKLASPASTEDITISRPYDPVRDQPVVKRLRPRVGRLRATVSVQPTDADLVAVGAADVYANALLIGVSAPEADASSGDVGVVELVFAVESVA